MFFIVAPVSFLAILSFLIAATNKQRERMGRRDGEKETQHERFWSENVRLWQFQLQLHVPSKNRLSNRTGTTEDDGSARGKPGFCFNLTIHCRQVKLPLSC